MAAWQLWLFDPPKPLVERFGEDFFRALPTWPDGIADAAGALDATQPGRGPDYGDDEYAARRPL